MFYQCLTDSLLNLVMIFFFLIQNLLLLIFCMDDRGLYIMFYFIFISIIIQINRLYFFRTDVLFTFPAFLSLGYKVILSKVCNMIIKWCSIISTKSSFVYITNFLHTMYYFPSSINYIISFFFIAKYFFFPPSVKSSQKIFIHTSPL